MLMVRAARCEVRALERRLVEANVPDVESWQPPPASFQAPVTAGSSEIARTAEPPPAWRCSP